MKKVIKLTESDLKTIVERVISEQYDERQYIVAIQKFLNSKKIYGDKNRPLVLDGRTDNNMMSQTAQAIAKFQKTLPNVEVDGIWGQETNNAMTQQDKKMLEKFLGEDLDVITRFTNWLSRLIS